MTGRQKVYTNQGFIPIVGEVAGTVNEPRHLHHAIVSRPRRPKALHPGLTDRCAARMAHRDRSTATAAAGHDPAPRPSVQDGRCLTAATWAVHNPCAQPLAGLDGSTAPCRASEEGARSGLGSVMTAPNRESPQRPMAATLPPPGAAFQASALSTVDSVTRVESPATAIKCSISLTVVLALVSTVTFW